MLQSYFIPQEGFLSGLSLSSEKVTLNPEYQSVLRFYGFDMTSFNTPIYPADITTTTQAHNMSTSEKATTEMVPATEMSTMKRNNGETTLKDTTVLETTTRASTKFTPEDRTMPSVTVSTTTTLQATTTPPTTETTITLGIENREGATEPMTTETTTTSTASTATTQLTTTQGTTVVTTTLTSTLPTTQPTTTEKISTQPITTEKITTTLGTSKEEETTTPEATTTTTKTTAAEETTIEDKTTEQLTEKTIKESTPAGTTTTETSETESTTLETTTELTTTQESTKKKRSLLDYYIARYYDDNQDITSFHLPHFPRRETPKQINYSFLVNEKFEETGVHFMTYDVVLPFYYIRNLNSLALKFPLDSPKYYLLLILPVDTCGIHKLICDIDSTISLKEIVQQMRPTFVRAVIPSFMLRGFVVLTSTLQKVSRYSLCNFCIVYLRE